MWQLKTDRCEAQDKFPKTTMRCTTLAVLSLLVTGCSDGSSKSESDQSSSTEGAIEQTQVSIVGDPQLADVESDQASMDADLEVIDQAIAELDSVALSAIPPISISTHKSSQPRKNYEVSLHTPHLGYLDDSYRSEFELFACIRWGFTRKRNRINRRTAVVSSSSR